MTLALVVSGYTTTSVCVCVCRGQHMCQLARQCASWTAAVGPVVVLPKTDTYAYTRDTCWCATLNSSASHADLISSNRENNPNCAKNNIWGKVTQEHVGFCDW